MGLEIIEERLKTYYGLDVESASMLAIEHSLKEMMQEIALRGLALSGFFKYGTFQGGTCLRIMHKMQRFSEDLDFTLARPGPSFKLDPYIEAVGNELSSFGIESDIQDKGKSGVAVAKQMVTMKSVEKILNIRSGIDRRKNIKIKLEVDTKPPDGQKTEAGSVLWPSAFAVVMQDIPTLFAGKLHALLCRTYEKGRDWFDLIWYVQRKASINFVYLENALIQTSDLADGKRVDLSFVKDELKKKLESINLKNIIDDVAPLVDDRKIIDSWTKKVFQDLIDRV